MSEREAILDAIRERRGTRDRIMFENLIIPTVNNLRQTVDSWVDGEFKDLEDEISYVDNFAPTDSATKRLDGFRKELLEIRNNQLSKASKQLDDLVEYIKQQKYESVSQIISMLNEKLTPILIVMSNLIKARERLDGMAEMIPLASIEENRESNER
jgi:hypothetical protein